MLKYLTAAALGGIFTVFVVAVYVLNLKQDLSVWHTEHLDQEFTKESEVGSFADYLKLEEGLFSQLQSDVYDQIDPEERLPFNRYNAGSRSDPNSESQNWNRTFEIVVKQPSAVAVLLHGLSDSPYSLQTVSSLPEIKTPRLRQKAWQELQETHKDGSAKGWLPSASADRMAPVGQTPTQRFERVQSDVKVIFPKSWSLIVRLFAAGDTSMALSNRALIAGICLFP